MGERIIGIVEKFTPPPPAKNKQTNKKSTFKLMPCSILEILFFLFYRTPQKSRWQQVIRSLLYMVQALAGYILMVMAMTFNAWIMVSIVLGSGLGYYLIRHVLHTAECRAKKFKLAQKRLMASPPLLQPQPQPRPEVCMCAKIKEATVAECRKERWPADDPLLKSLRATADGKETAV